MRISDWSSDVCSSDLDVADLLDDERGQSERWLVEEQDLRLGHQRPPDGHHLLLAAREVAGGVAAAALQHREEVHHAVVGLVDPLLVPPGEGAGAEVLVDGELGEDPPALHHLGQAGAHRSEEHTSELQSLMRISYAGFCLKKKKNKKNW